MEDIIKKESEVTKVTTLADTDCVRVTLANGQSASIKKSDLMPIIKDEIGKLLGNTDALSTFTNVLVNNGQTLGKATIENLASVVSGEYIGITLLNLEYLINKDFQIGFLDSGDTNSKGIYLHIHFGSVCIQFIFRTMIQTSYIRSYDFANNIWNNWILLF